MIRSTIKFMKNFLDRYPKWICEREFKSQAFTRFNERPIEFAFVFKTISRIYPRTVLDVGTGTTALPHLMRNCGCLVTAIDNVRDYWPSGMVNRHYHVIDDDITATRISQNYDLITCISVLEHIERHTDAIRNMFALLNPKGHLIVTCPYNEGYYTRNVYDLPNSSYGKGAPYITQSYSRKDLAKWVKENNATIADQEYWQFWEGDHWTVGKQIIPPKQVTCNVKHQHTCILFQKN